MLIFKKHKIKKIKNANFFNNNHIFTTVLVSSSYKYAEELKQHAQNMLLFAPQSVNHDFAAYNTFLSKLNNDECIAFGDGANDVEMLEKAGIAFEKIIANENLELAKEFEIKQAPTIVVVEGDTVTKYAGITEVKSFISANAKVG